MARMTPSAAFASGQSLVRIGNRIFRRQNRTMSAIQIGFTPRHVSTPRKEEDLMERYKGEVKWFNNAKGYGFLGSEGIADVFCHFSAIQIDGYKSLKEGELVEFAIIPGPSGRPQADAVTRLHPPEPKPAATR